MEELWAGYQEKFDFQQRLHKANLGGRGSFKNKADAILKTLKKLQVMWKYLGSEDQVFFFQHYIENQNLAFFVNEQSLVDSSYGPVRDLDKARTIFSNNLNEAIADLSMGRGIYFQGNKEKIANKWLVKKLIDYWVKVTGERPRKSESHASVQFVGEALAALREHLEGDISPAAKEVKSLSEEINYLVPCGQIVDAHYRQRKKN